MLRLTRKTFAVLQYLVEHPGQLVTKDELFAAVWPMTAVGDAVLAVCIRDIRQALGDSPRRPQFIETVYGRGYRLLVPVTVAGDPLARHNATLMPSLAPDTSPPSSIRLVGREAESTRLQQWFKKALHGERQVVFITGEVGIGKTTLIEAFVERVVTDGVVWLGHGQCVDQYGAGEAYLPLLEALGRLCRTHGGGYLRPLLHRYAPSWLLQMPALLSAVELEALQHHAHGATQARMLRELAEAVDMLTAERPLVLVLEDLHWSDDATLAWLAFVARRREKARLLIIGTYRPVEVRVRAHPVLTVVQELLQHGQCEELRLAYLPETAIETYLASRFAHHGFLNHLARAIHQRTSGNPLFMVTVVDALVRQGILHEGPKGWALLGTLEGATARVPESLRQFIEQQLGQVSLADQGRLGQLCSRLSYAFRVTGNYDQAMAYARRGVAIGETLGDGAVQTQSTYRLGQAYRILGDYQRASTCLRRIVHTHQGGAGQDNLDGFPSVFARAQLALCLAERGEFAEGITHGAEGVQTAEAVNNPFGRIVSYGGIGGLYLRQGAFPDAIRVLDRAFDLCRHWDMLDWFSTIATFLGTAYSLAGHVAAALPLLEQAVEQGRTLGKKAGQAFVMASLGEVYLRAGRAVDALDHARQALELSQAYKERGTQAWSLRLLGEITAQVNPLEVEPSRTHYQQALTLANELGMRPLQAHCHQGLGTLYSQTGPSEQARAKLAAAIAMYRDMEMTFWLPETAAVLAAVEGKA